jgi:hypothetical protein
MKCTRCQRGMTADEPAYHLFISAEVYPHRQMCCTGCAEAYPTRWLPPLPCHRCSRLVYRGRPLRRGVTRTYCSDQCGQHVYNALYRQRHPRPRLEHQCACGKTFTPQRRNARFCSDACRQRAYRERAQGG